MQLDTSSHGEMMQFTKKTAYSNETSLGSATVSKVGPVSESVV
jgi:hypothetical protein